jgi:hypothetical protein
MTKKTYWRRCRAGVDDYLGKPFNSGVEGRVSLNMLLDFGLDRVALPFANVHVAGLPANEGFIRLDFARQQSESALSESKAQTPWG